MNLIKVSEIQEIPKIYSEDLKKLVMKMMTRDSSKRPNTTQLLKDPVLVDLMIKNSSSMSLKK
jgi:serine/threonine protein kinase